MENKKKKTLAIVLGIFALVIVTTAASFAFFTYSRTGTTTSTIISGDIEFSFIEGDSATLANAFPVADNVGAVDTTAEYSFDVKLASSSNSNKMNYNVLLVDNNDDTGVNYFNNEQIKFSLVKNNTYVANTSSTSGVKLSDIDGFDELSNQGEGIVLQDQEITAGTIDNYKLRIWISDDVNYSNTQNGQDNQESSGKHNSYKYSLKVKVTSGVSSGENTSGITITMGVKNLTMTADIEAKDGLSAYAVTNNSTVPLEYSNEWIDLNTSAKSNVLRTNTTVTQKRINYVANDNGIYYLHVKNSNNKIITKSFTINVDAQNASLYIMNLAKTNTNELRIDEHEATGQQDFSVTEYRYYGNNPNNNVLFNDEVWKIIGVMDVDDGTGNIEKRVKLLRDLAGAYSGIFVSWDSSPSNINKGRGINEWSQSDLMYLINEGAYYNRSKGVCYINESNQSSECDYSSDGLTEETKEMIGDAKWYLGAVPGEFNDLDADDYYRYERGELTGKICNSSLSECNDTVERKNAWVGKLGLIYPSDYGYASNLNICDNVSLSNFSNECKESNYMSLHTNKNIARFLWTITPWQWNGYPSASFILEQGDTITVHHNNNAATVKPSIYLKSDIKIVDGDGSELNPFILSK